MGNKILIVDDEDNIRLQLIKLLKLDGFDAYGAENGLSALKLINEEPPDCLVTDLKMPGLDGQQLVEKIRNDGKDFPIIMLSAYGFASDAVQALKSGVNDYLMKPFDPDELIVKIKDLIQAQGMKNNIKEIQSDEADSNHIFIGNCPEIQKIKAMCAQLGSSTANVLILGESGTGKEVLARYIHKNSVFKNGPFVGVNIASIPDTLIESELFGYEKGAFTGANTSKKGLFEEAENGTIFLDEIADAPMNLQVKLLRVLQEREVMHLGASSPIPINTRLVAATNKDMVELIKNNKFREDLYYRLNLVSFTLPPLRERGDDIILLSSSIVSKLNKRTGKNIKGISPDALNKLKQHKFYGNIRELENTLERAMIFCTTEEIQEKDLAFLALDLNEQKSIFHGTSSLEARSLDDIEKEAIRTALLRNANNRTKTAEELGITRKTLLNKIAQYNLD